MAARRAGAGGLPSYLALLAVAGCGGEEALQIVQGTLTQPALQVRAFADQAPTATAPVQEGGLFVLALPVGAHRLEVVLAADVAVPLGPPEGLRVCEASGPVDLGPVAMTPIACPPDPACLAAEVDLDLCLTHEAPICDDLAQQVDECRRRREAECAPFAQALAACSQGQPACPAEQEALDRCLMGHDCFGVQEAFFNQCVPPPCRPHQAHVDQACAGGPPPCEGALSATPTTWPGPVGCEGAP